MALATGASYPKLAREFGRHHNSIMAAVDKVQLMTLSNERVRDDVLAADYGWSCSACGVVRETDSFDEAVQQQQAHACPSWRVP